MTGIILPRISKQIIQFCSIIITFGGRRVTWFGLRSFFRLGPLRLWTRRRRIFIASPLDCASVVSLCIFIWRFWGLRAIIILTGIVIVVVIVIWVWAAGWNFTPCIVGFISSNFQLIPNVILSAIYVQIVCVCFFIHGFQFFKSLQDKLQPQPG